MAEYLTKESLKKAQRLIDIIEQALEGKGLSIKGIKVDESISNNPVEKDGMVVTWTPVHERTFQLVIEEKEPDILNRPFTVTLNTSLARKIAKIGSNKIKED